tara:strand:+ start:42 stop:569 length:528 start_codon:yes stop_codon:yes gene_type:complete
VGIAGLTLTEITGTKYTLSYHMILPMLPGDKDHYMEEYLLQVYSYYNKEYCIGLLYINMEKEDPVFKKLITAFQIFRNFKDIEYTDNKIFVCFDIPKCYVDDFNLIIKSKYSVISNMLKGRIRKFHDLNLDDGIASIIYKTIERKEHLEELLGVKISEDIDLFEEFNLNKNTYNE